MLDAGVLDDCADIGIRFRFARGRAAPERGSSMSAEITQQLTEIANAHSRLRSDLAVLDDNRIREETPLPGWTRAHVGPTTGAPL